MPRSSSPTTRTSRSGAPRRRKGKLRGVGFSCYIEACGIAPSAVVGSLGCGVGLWESAKVRFSHTGMVQVLTGTHTHGQGHETTFAQLIAEKLGVPIDNVEVIHGDTDKTPVGMGTYGSRSIAVGGQAIVNACDKIIEKGKKIAAHLLEAAEGDIEFKDGGFTVKGTDRAKSIGEVVFEAYVPHHLPYGMIEPGMEETAFYDPANFTYPAGCYICEVEVDPDTGIVRIDRFVAVDDFGKVINPMIVEGQVHGGLAQGIGQALTEACVYDENGQLISASYMDYSMPKAGDVPSFQVAMTVTPCTHNTLGVKGCGEAGAIEPPAVMNAVTDAIGVRLDMPATPEKVWRPCRAGRCPRRRNRGTIMYAFEYHRPSTVAEAVSLLVATDGRFLAGGHTLLPTLKQRLASPSDLIDLGGLKELKGILIDRGSQLRIGAMTPHAEVAGSADVRGCDPGARVSRRAHRRRAGAQPRHHRRLDRQQRPRRRLPGRDRRPQRHGAHQPAPIAGDDFFTGMFDTALNDGEIITEVRFPKPDKAGYAKFPNPASATRSSG